MTLQLGEIIGAKLPRSRTDGPSGTPKLGTSSARTTSAPRKASSRALVRFKGCVLGKANRPVMLKRGLSSTVKELLMSAEYVVAHGNPNVILCERGIRTFETATRNTCDITAVAVLNELSHLPVVLDPSHATGKRSLVPPLSRAGVAIGADGLIVEVHPQPEKAMSDGAQSLTLQQFSDMMRELKPYISLWQTARMSELATA